MSFLMRLRNWLNLKNSKVLLRSRNIMKEQRVLDRLGLARDIFERSYYQYQCQMAVEGILVRTIYNLISMPLFGFVIIYYWVRGAIKTSQAEEHYSIIFDATEDITLLPEEESGKIGIVCFEGGCLKKTDWLFIKQNLIKRYPFSVYFITKNLIKMIQYRELMIKYNPEKIIVCNEYSFTSSFLTAFCHYNKIQHINIIHGEKVFNIRDAYFQFDKCYIWDSYYKSLFRKLNVEEKQFIVSPPKKFLEMKKEQNIDFIYYLQNESTKELYVIHDILLELQNQGYIVKYRPHPIYANKNIKNIFGDLNGENPKEVSIEESISSTRNVISRYSTVLFQAFLNGIDVVIDDISIPQEYEKLKQLRYIMLNKPHKLLSQYILIQHSSNGV